MKKSRLIACGWLAFFFVFSTSALAIDTLDNSGWDLSVQVGGILGNASQTTTDETVGTESVDYSFGGFPVGLGLNKDFARWLSTFFRVTFVLDFSNVQITRTGFDLGAALHLLGGSRRTVRDYGVSETVYGDSYNLSLLTCIGFHRYGASSSDNLDQLNGSVFETEAGLQYRFDLDPNNSLFVEFLVSLYSLPAGVERISTRLYTFLLGYRFFL